MGKTRTQILWNVAIGLAEDNPVEAKRVLRLVPKEEGQIWMHPAIAWKLAMSDPTLARRLVDESQQYDDSPQTYLYLSCGLKGRDPAATEEAFWKGIKGIDRLLETGAEYFARKIRGGTSALMPLVEQIDPDPCARGFVAHLPARPPIDNPRSLNEESLGELVEFLGWYDCEVAAAVLETDLVQREQNDNQVLAAKMSRFLSWLLLDPRDMVTKIEQLRTTDDRDTKSILELRRMVGKRLGRSYEDQWRLVWCIYGYGQMKNPLDLDIW